MKRFYKYFIVFTLLVNSLPINVKALTANISIETIEIENVTYEITTTKTNEYVTVVTVGSNGEYHEFEYDIVENNALLDDNPFNMSITIENDEIIPDPTNITTLSNWTPVYATTFKTNFQEQIATIGALCTVVGGVIAGANLAGLTLPSIYGTISDWASLCGLTVLGAAAIVSGYFRFEQWRTSGPVTYTGYSYPLYLYRNQDASVYFSLLGNVFEHEYNKIGSWFSNQRPDMY